MRCNVMRQNHNHRNDSEKLYIGRSLCYILRHKLTSITNIPQKTTIVDNYTQIKQRTFCNYKGRLKLAFFPPCVKIKNFPEVGMKDLGFIRNVVGTAEDKNHHIYEAKDASFCNYTVT